MEETIILFLAAHNMTVQETSKEVIDDESH